VAQARQWWDERRQDYIDFESPELEVEWDAAEPTVLYGPDGSVLVSWTPPVGFARAIDG